MQMLSSSPSPEQKINPSWGHWAPSIERRNLMQLNFSDIFRPDIKPNITVQTHQNVHTISRLIIHSMAQKETPHQKSLSPLSEE